MDGAVGAVSGPAMQGMRSSENDPSCPRFRRREVQIATVCREQRNIVRSVCCFVTKSCRTAIFPPTPNLFCERTTGELNDNAWLLSFVRIGTHCSEKTSPRHLRRISRKDEATSFHSR